MDLSRIEFYHGPSYEPPRKASSTAKEKVSFAPHVRQQPYQHIFPPGTLSPSEAVIKALPTRGPVPPLQGYGQFSAWVPGPWNTFDIELANLEYERQFLLQRAMPAQESGNYFSTRNFCHSSSGIGMDRSGSSTRGKYWGYRGVWTRSTDRTFAAMNWLCPTLGPKSAAIASRAPFELSPDLTGLPSLSLPEQGKFQDVPSLILGSDGENQPHQIATRNQQNNRHGKRAQLQSSAFMSALSLTC